MNYDLVAAIIVLIRASATGTAVGGRIYQGSQVPPNVPFPRCYVNLRRSPNYVQYNRADGGIDRTQVLEILFAQTTANDASPFRSIESWDKAVRTLLNYNVIAPNLISFRRVADSPTSQQADDLNTYLTGGGLYEAMFQEG